MLKKIEKPNIDLITKDEKFSQRFSHPTEDLGKVVQKSFSPYSHWEQIKFWKMPDDVSNIEAWALIKILRKNIFEKTQSIVMDEKGSHFSWVMLPNMNEFLHQVDMKLGGNLFVFGGHVDKDLQHHLLTRGVMEEAIASSQLEGAHTSRKVAKQIILEGKKPRNTDEQMIVNNYEAMRIIENDLKTKKIDEDTLMMLHRVLTKDTKIDKEAIGRYRRDDDDIVVGDNGGNGDIYHIPPKQDFLKKEMKRFIAYANNDLNDEGFIHPVIKATVLHFWFGYLHPYVDGNGRMARAIFYWYLLREKYWAFGYLPLSKVIKNSPAQYRDAYIYSEQDDNDLTYFIDYNIRKISQAMKEFEEYAERKMKENTKMAKLARGKYNLNNRQIQLLRYLYKNPDASTSLSSHGSIYEVSRVTSAKDLNKLVESGFITPKKAGRIIYFYAKDKISELFD